MRGVECDVYGDGWVWGGFEGGEGVCSGGGGRISRRL